MKNGFTLIEAMITMGISTAVATGGIQYFQEQSEKDQVEALSSKITKIISAIDQRVYIDKYNPSLWPTTNNYPTTRQTQEFLNRELIARSSSADCADTVNGWVPQKETFSDPADQLEEDTYKDSLRLVPCSLLGTKQFVELGLTTSLDFSITPLSIEHVNLYLRYSDMEDFTENYLNLKQLLLKLKEEDLSNVTGSHTYKFVDLTKSKPNTTDLTNQECLSIGVNCGLLAQYSGDGDGVEYLDVNGSNAMINSKITFKENVTDLTKIEDCFSYEFNSTTRVWERKASVECGLGITESGTPIVEANVYSASAKKFQLDKLCDLSLSGTTVQVPCGMYIEESTGIDTAIGVIDELQSNSAFVNLLQVTDIETDNLSVDNKLEVAGDTDLNKLNVSGSAIFNETVTFNHTGNTVDQDLTVSGMTEVDRLIVNSEARFKKDITVSGILDVTNGYIKADHLKLDTITLGELHTLCSIEGALKIYKNITKRHTEPAICATYTNLAGHTKMAWKLANARVGQILPFDGSCPDGFTYHEGAAGRFLVGQNETQLAGKSSTEKNALVSSGKAFRDPYGNIIEYKTGETGGEAFHALTEDEMPSHQHDVPDIKASCSGSNCAGYAMATVGARGDTVWSTENEIPTGTAGSGQSHENRPPYYTVNYCIYGG